MQKEICDRIKIIQDDITRQDVGAIVNAANKSLLGGGGVDGAIHRAAGPDLLAECKTLNGCETGEAKITKGYRLPAKFVIHTVGPIYGGTVQDATLLAACYRNSLKLAVDNDIRTIAFPAISCGVYGYPLQEACKIAIDTTVDFLKTHMFPQQVIFVLFSSELFDIYQHYFNQL